MGLGVRGRVGWGTWPRGTQCERQSRLGHQCGREKRLGRLSYGKQCERKRGRVGWGTWPKGTQPERESRLGHLTPGDSM